MKNQALFSSKDKVKNENVVCCNFCLALQGLTSIQYMLFLHGKAFLLNHFRDEFMSLQIVKYQFINCLRTTCL